MDAAAPLVVNEKQAAIVARREHKAIDRRWNREVSLTLALWLALTVGLGFAIGGSGPLIIMTAWAWVLGVAVFTTPVMAMVVRRINQRAHRARAQLAEASEEEAPSFGHLPEGLANFAQDTRVARFALLTAVDHDEGIRQLWDWRRSYEELSDAHLELARTRGVGLGPVGDFLGSGNERSPDLNDERIAQCVAHLQHVEALLAAKAGPGYR